MYENIINDMMTYTCLHTHTDKHVDTYILTKLSYSFRYIICTWKQKYVTNFIYVYAHIYVCVCVYFHI